MRARRLGVLGATVGMVVGAAVPAAAAPSLLGGGSTLAGLAFAEWTTTVARAPYDLRVDYQGVGSGAGRVNYANGVYDFGVSDIPFTPDEQTTLLAASGRDAFVYVPVVAAAVGIGFNVSDEFGQRIVDLELTPRLACRLFTEASISWNDPELVALNPALANVDRPVRKIIRQDPAGTSYVFSQWCIARAPEVWSALVEARRLDGTATADLLAGGPISEWLLVGPGGSAVGADQVSQSVADLVRGRDTVAFEASGYWIVYQVPSARVQNAAGNFTEPAPSGATAGLAGATTAPDGTLVVDYRMTDPEAYQPSTFSYVIAQTTGLPVDKGDVLGRFLCYAVTTGQEVVEQYNYARLSPDIARLAEGRIAQIPGAPATCGLGPSPVIPEAPLAVLVPLVALAVLGGSAGLIRRRTRAT